MNLTLYFFLLAGSLFCFPVFADNRKALYETTIAITDTLPAKKQAETKENKTSEKSKSKPETSKPSQIKKVPKAKKQTPPKVVKPKLKVRPVKVIKPKISGKGIGR